MKKERKLLFVMLPMLALTIASCGNKNNNSTSGNNTSTKSSEAPSETYTFEQKEDTYGLIPERVRNANCDIDFLVYIEGQNGTIEDIGNYSPDPNSTPKRKYSPEDVTSIEMARWFGAAQAFKEFAPNVRVNLIYCSIDDYNDYLKTYKDTHGHVPQLLWATDHVGELLNSGFNTDLSVYADSEYYQSYNEYFMSRFNYGGFQAGFPIAAEPWGVFVNTDSLERYFVLNEPVVDPVTGECSDEYKDWVDNFTWDNFMDAVAKTTTPDHAGLSQLVEYFMSYSIASINESYIKTGRIDLTSDEVRPVIEKLLKYENKLASNEGTDDSYCVWRYPDFSSRQEAVDVFANAKTWLGTQNFVEDKYATFYAEAPWALTTLSSYMQTHNLSTRIDFLPYPKVDENADPFTGIAVEGLTVGNQCPVGTDGLEHCYSANSKLETDVAAYFAMFMACDARSIESMSKVKYVFGEGDARKTYTGQLSLPLVKKGFRFSWQDNPELNANDPSAAYADNFDYNLKLWFDLYKTYLTSGTEAKVNEKLSNVMYGLTKMIDSIYGNKVTCLNFWNEPVRIPNETGTGVEDIFRPWQARYTYYNEQETSYAVSQPTYVSKILEKLPEIEAKINDNSDGAWGYLQENVDMYYGYDSQGNSIYDVLNKTFRDYN